MCQILTSVLDPPIHLRQLETLKLSYALWMVCSVYYPGCMILNINVLFAE